MGVTLLLVVGTSLLLLLPEQSLAASLSVETATTILGVIAAVYFLCTALLVVALFCLCCRRGQQCRIFPYKGEAYFSQELELSARRTPAVFGKGKKETSLASASFTVETTPVDQDIDTGYATDESKATQSTGQPLPGADQVGIALVKNKAFGLDQELGTTPQSTAVGSCVAAVHRREVHETTPTRDSQLLQNHTYEQIQDYGVTSQENPSFDSNGEHSDNVFNHSATTPGRIPQTFEQAKQEAKKKRKDRTDSTKPLINGSESRCSESSCIEELSAPSPLPEVPEDVHTPVSTPSHRPINTSMTARERPSRTSATGALGDFSFFFSGPTHSAGGISGLDNPMYGIGDLSGEGDAEEEELSQL